MNEAADWIDLDLPFFFKQFGFETHDSPDADAPDADLNKKWKHAIQLEYTSEL